MVTPPGRVLKRPLLGLVIETFGDTGLALRAPDLGGPGKDSQMLVAPVVKDPRDDLLGMVLKVMVDRDGWVAGQLCPLLTNGLIRPQILGRERVIGLRAVGPQKHARVRMKRHCVADILVARDKGHQCPRLGLTRGIRPCAKLLALGAPVAGEVAV